MQVYSSVLEMIGRTPLLRVNRFDTGKCELYLKLELMNPAGSIKDRIGVSMIEEAERRGDIKPGDTLVEATAGNTGLGVALVAAAEGLSAGAGAARQDEPGEDLQPARAWEPRSS